MIPYTERDTDLNFSPPYRITGVSALSAVRKIDARAAQEWLDGAARHDGSWWPAWTAWLDTLSSGRVKARTPKNTIEPAPGSYVKIVHD